MIKNKLSSSSKMVLACLQQGKPMSAVSIRNATKLHLRLVKDGLYRLSINKEIITCGETRRGYKIYKIYS